MRAEQVLIFDWPFKRWFSPRFLVLFLVSTLFHAAAFFVFQVVEKSVVRSPDRERGVTLLSSDVPEHRFLLESVEAEAPTMALSHRLLPADELLRVPYRSSFDGVGSVVRDVGLLRRKDAYPVPGGVLGRGSNRSVSGGHSGHDEKIFAGRVEFSDPLAGRAFNSRMPVPRLPFSHSLNSPTYWVGVSPKGDVQYVLLGRSSGSDEADAEGASFLKSLTFDPRGAGIEWADVSVVFGSPASSGGVAR